MDAYYAKIMLFGCVERPFVKHGVISEKTNTASARIERYIYRA